MGRELRGWLVRGLRLAEGERALLAAVVGRAVREAQRGNPEAAEWLDEVGAAWLVVFLGFDAARAAGWRDANLAARPAVDVEKKEKVNARRRAVVCAA